MSVAYKNFTITLKQENFNFLKFLTVLKRDEGADDFSLNRLISNYSRFLCFAKNLDKNLEFLKDDSTTDSNSFELKYCTINFKNEFKYTDDILDRMVFLKDYDEDGFKEKYFIADPDENKENVRKYLNNISVFLTEMDDYLEYIMGLGSNHDYYDYDYYDDE